MIQLSAMLALGRLMAEVARKFKQPAVVGEIVAGIILGPTILGIISPGAFDVLFPKIGNSTLALDGFTRVAVVLLLFIAGLEVDLHIVFQQGKQALSTSFFGLIIPFFLGFIIPFLFPAFFGDTGGTDLLLFSLFMGTAMSISALPVIVRIMMDLKLFKTRIGMLVVASAMVDDLIGWMIFSVILGFLGKGPNISFENTIFLGLSFSFLRVTWGVDLLIPFLQGCTKKMAGPDGFVSLWIRFC